MDLLQEKKSKSDSERNKRVAPTVKTVTKSGPTGVSNREDLMRVWVMGVKVKLGDKFGLQRCNRALVLEAFLATPQCPHSISPKKARQTRAPKSTDPEL
jgi:hypothetical protein